MKRVSCVLLCAVFLIFGCAGKFKVEKKPIFKKVSLFPESEYEKNFTFPPIIGPLTLTDKIDLEKTNPGLGYSTVYGDNITSLAIYIYDMQIKSIPDDINSGLAIWAFQEAAGEIFAQEKKGTYSQLKYSEGRTTNLSGKNMLLSTFEYEFDHAKKFSVLMFTVHKGKFFKARLTIDKGKDAFYIEDSIKIIEEITDDILSEDMGREYLTEAE
jgi:hypothetical protein